MRRAHIEKTYRRPFMDRALRRVLAAVLPYPGRFRLALLGAKIGRPFRRLLPDPRLRAMLEMAAAAGSPPSAATTTRRCTPRRGCGGCGSR